MVMAHTHSLRRSGRQRFPNKKYTVDTFEGLDILNSDSEVDLEALQQLRDSRNDHDFPEDHIDINEDDESLADGVSDGSAILTPEGEHEEANSYANSDSEGHGHQATSQGRRRKPKDYTSTRDSHVHSRGMVENLIKADHEKSRLRLFAGSAVEDIMHVVRSRDQWAVDPTLPSRGSLCHQVSHTDEKRRMEATVGWDWYYDHGGRKLFAEKQDVKTLSLDEGATHLPKATNSSLSFLMGPYGRQQVLTLALSQSLGLDEAWYTASGPPEQSSEGFESRKRPRIGWMLNVGARVRCLDWAPNHHGKMQYLALAVAKNLISAHPAMPNEAPAFTPSGPTPSGVQIWAFDASNNPTAASRPPELQQVLCTEWGEVNQLKWCPVPRAERSDHATGKIFIGLLAGIWGDGYARVLDVQAEKEHGAVTTYCKFLHDQLLGVREIIANYPNNTSKGTVSRIFGQPSAFAACRYRARRHETSQYMRDLAIGDRCRHRLLEWCRGDL